MSHTNTQKPTAPEYKVFPFKENRFAIYQAAKIVDDAQGYGYKTYANAILVMNYRFNGGREKQKHMYNAFKRWRKDPINKAILARYNYLFDNYTIEILKDEITQTEILNLIEEEYSLKIPEMVFDYIVAD